MSKTQDTLMVRYTGTDANRRFLIQRGDGKFWTGEGYSKILDNAKVYTDHKTAQTSCAALQYQRYKGKKLRTFKLEVTISLASDSPVTQEQLTEFLSKALRLDMENSIHGDGPVEDSFVQARVKLSSLEETPATRKVF